MLLRDLSEQEMKKAVTQGLPESTRLLFELELWRRFSERRQQRTWDMHVAPHNGEREK